MILKSAHQLNIIMSKPRASGDDPADGETFIKKVQ